jgi:hypothetical protein
VNENIAAIVNNVGTDISGKWVSTDKIANVVEATVKECIAVVENTPTHCAYTTHDLGTVTCTIRKSVESIKNHFEVKQ